MSAPQYRDRPGVDQSVVDLVTIIAFAAVVITLILTVGFGDLVGSSTALTLAKAALPAMVIVAVVVLGRRVAGDYVHNMDDGAKISFAAITGFSVVALAVVVALLVGNTTVQSTIEDLVIQFLPIIAVVVGAVVGLAAGGRMRSRDMAGEASGGRRFGPGAIIGGLAVILVAVVALAVIGAIVWGDSQVPESIENIIDDLTPIIATVVGLLAGYVIAVAQPRFSRRSQEESSQPMTAQPDTGTSMSD